MQGNFPELSSPLKGSVVGPLGVMVDSTAPPPGAGSICTGRPWACHLTSLRLSVLVFKVGVTEPPTSLGYCEEKNGL